MVTRRSFLSGLVAAAAASTSLLSRTSRATVARSATLGELLAASQHVVLGAATDSYAAWEQVGGRACIVTYSTFAVEQHLAGKVPETSELTVRTMGGTVGGLGQIFYGEAVVAIGQRAAVFLRSDAPELFSVTAMSQGYYRVAPDAQGAPRLHAAFGREVIDSPSSAMHRLHGCTLTEALALFSKERPIAR